MIGLSDAHEGLGRDAEAIDYLEQARDLMTAAVGPRSYRTAFPIFNLGAMYYNTGDYARAARAFEQAREIYIETFGTEHPYVAFTLTATGQVEIERDAPAKAVAVCSRALAIDEQAHGKDSSELIRTLNCLGEAELDRGREREAIAHLERARRIQDVKQVEPIERADTAFLLARALVRQPARRSKAIELAKEARDGYIDKKPASAKQLARVERWLAKYRARSSER
jgi:tetratricopeptide (TPR) repeat protein